MESTFLIVDVSNMAYRSFFANAGLRTQKGKPSGHIYGTVQSLLAATRNELSGLKTTFCFCYDGKESKVRRRKVLPEYKANRPPRDFNPMPEVEELLSSWPGIHVKQDDSEGDDAICYAVKMRQGRPCIVWSGDKDLWLLMQYPRCRIWSPNLKRFVDSTDFHNPYRVEDPRKIPLCKSLFGDSDNLKGVERLTKKQVEPFLNQVGVETPEQFYQALGATRPDSISVKNWDKLLASREKVQKNYEVVLPQLDFQKESVTRVSGGFDLLKQKLIEYECFSLVQQLG